MYVLFMYAHQIWAETALALMQTAQVLQKKLKSNDCMNFLAGLNTAWRRAAHGESLVGTAAVEPKWREAENGCSLNILLIFVLINEHSNKTSS